MLDKKLSLLQEIFGNCNHSGTEFLFWCPACKHHKPKMSINIDKNKFKCWVCDWSGNSIHRLVRKYGDNSQYKRWTDLAGKLDMSDPENQDFFLETEERPPIINLPDEFVSLSSKSTIYSQPAFQYLKDRGLSYQDILYWKIGYCSSGLYEKRVIIPSFDLLGHINYFIARTYDKHSIAYKNPSVPKDLVFSELYLDWNKPIILVEGVFDAIVAGNAIPLLGSTLRENSYLFSKIVMSSQRIYLALDIDAQAKQRNIAHLLQNYGVETYIIDVEPYKDCGSMTKEQFQIRKNLAQEFSSDRELEMYIKAAFE